MRGYIANTDFDWYRHLSQEIDLDEVNFWQPSGRRGFGAVPPGAPFLFKLKKPHYAIAGLGFFAHASRIPASLAWEAFGRKNGAGSFPEMLLRIRRYRREGKEPSDDPSIGCLMIADPVFFEREEWIAQPRDWPKQAVQGKSYDLGEGEGRRVWEACLARLASRRVMGKPDSEAALVAADRRFGPPTVVRPRLGQGAFRFAVLDAYGRACAVTTEHSLPVLESAHIRPYSEGGEHRLSNGLLLRSDLHRLFDKGFVTVTPDLHFRVSPRLRDLWKNGRTYYQFDGQRIHLPGDALAHPDKRQLEWHSEEVFQR